MHASVRSVRHHLLLVVFLTAAAYPTAADEPLHRRIDQAFYATAVGPIADKADDLNFARRAYLDLNGRIPAIEEVRAYLASPPENRRTQLIDQLIASKEISGHLATTFDVMLMERRGGKHVKSDDFRAWLRASFEQDKPFHQLAAELITADTSGANRAAAAFLLERDVEPNLLTREIGRMYFGMDLQCAQCHDHPNVDDYKQEDYYGLYSFVSRSSLFQPDKKKPAVIAEAADGQSPFKSVFTSREAFTSPRMPGEMEVTEPVFEAGDEFRTRPAKTVAGVPMYSRRAKLAEFIASGSNHYFRRNIANRLWAMMMGRGLVHPVDMHHSMNPPSHPELMTLLADEFAAMNFQLKPFLRELALTDVYQRSHQFTRPQSVEVAALDATIKQLQLLRATANDLTLEKEDEAQAALEQLDAALASAEPQRAALAKVRTAATAAAKKRDDAVAAQQTKKAALDAKQAFAAAVTEALNSASAATNLLDSPKDLAATVAVLKTRSVGSTVEVTKLRQALDAAVKASTAANDVLTKARTAEKTERDKYTPLQPPLRQHRAAMVKAFKESQQAYILVTHRDHEVEYLQNLIRQADAVSRLPATQTAVADVAQEYKVAVQTVTSSEKQMAAAAKTMTEAATKQTNAQQTKIKLTGLIQQQQQASDALASALKSATSAAAVLQDESLTGMATELGKSTTRLVAAMSETNTQLNAASTEMETAGQTVAEMQEKTDAAKQQAEVARQQAATADKKKAELQTAVATLLTTKTEADASVIEQSTRQFHVATVECLTPEQLTWSILQASGQIERQVIAELAKLNKDKPLTEEQKSDAALLAQRQTDAEAAAVVSLTEAVAGFVKLFAAEQGQPQDDFFATVDQALLFANGSQIRTWLAPSGENLTGRLLKIETPDGVADELYLSTLVRKPTADEITDVSEYLAARGDKKTEAVQELAWALMTSAEFRFQH
ncbi:MAG: DUF1549 domain-containing protein [Fuerstiella sp.]|nr:DUF1549 domain-containing protein [Fuerstiella sp.]MCP4858451.1 DUF1549 domain-containing protein [Fuerstiella sp.]